MAAVPVAVQDAGKSQITIRDIIFVGGEFYLGDQIAGRIWKSGRMAPIAPPVISHVREAGGQTIVAFDGMAGFHYRVGQTKTVFATDERCTVTAITATNDPRFIVW
jgi:hypothetical protein